MPLSPKCPPPGLPPGCPDTRYFGTQIVRWGTHDNEAIARIATITVEELIAHGVTRGLLLEWLTFYECEFRREPRNPSVVGRVELLTHIARRLHWPEEAR